MTAALPMGGQKITGMADPTVSTDGATKNYVDTTTAAFFSTGDVKLTYKTTPDSGWVMMNDTTIGNVGSGASTASAACQALYTLFWNNISSPSANAYAVVTGGLGASAAADWAGLKSMSLPRSLGRALALAGAGASLTARSLGQFLGEETHALTVPELPTFTPSGTNAASAVTFNAIGNAVLWESGAGTQSGSAGTADSRGILTGTAAGQVFTGNSVGSNTPHNNMQPTSFINAMVKL